ncbi:hypothetical protein [Streptomyces sp. NPDC058751]|uniref:hypothetical protein n=1 Tax=Streptomyces sp. NPDC058751 TaxID=3346623 RepID=UPI0036B58252
MTSYICKVCREAVADGPGHEARSSITHSCDRTSAPGSRASADARQAAPSKRPPWRTGRSSRPRPWARLPRAVRFLVLLGVLALAFAFGLRVTDAGGDRVTHCPENVHRHDVC